MREEEDPMEQRNPERTGTESRGQRKPGFSTTLLLIILVGAGLVAAAAADGGVTAMKRST
jgi:hypothetical protein